MNVLFLTSTFPRSEKDNQVAWLAVLVRQLKKKGIYPTIYAPSYQGIRSHKYYSIPVVRFRYAPKPFEILTHGEGAVFKLRQKPWLFIVAFFYLIFGIVGIIQMRNRLKFDVIHVQWPFPNGIFGIVAKRLFHAKLIFTFHGAEFSLMNRVPFGKQAMRILLKDCDKVVANSSFTKKMIQAIKSTDVSIIPFSSAVTVKKSQVTLQHFSKGLFKILFVGRFIERKGIPYLIDAIHILRQKKIPVEFDIVGNGPLSKKLKKQIKALNLGKSVKIHENVDEAHLSKFYKSTDVFVLPAIIDQWNDTEGLGVVLIEAMSFGKPIVASKVGGIPDVVKHNKNGLLVKEKNPQALADALQMLFDQPLIRKKLGTNGLAYVKKCYNWKNIIDETIKLYKS